MWVYIYQSWTETELKNAYIGEWTPYTPTSSTIAYYPFISDQTDQTWNTSIPATWSKQTIWYRFTSGSSTLWITIPSNKQTSRFYSCWTKCITLPSWRYDYLSSMIINYGTMRFVYKGYDGNNQKQFWYWKDSSNTIYSSTQSIDLTNRFHIAYGCDSSNNYMGWINWNLVFSWQASPQRFLSTIDMFQWSNATIDYSDFILENRLWSVTETTNYYNNTKSNYWL